jgi:hypothetical protein
LGHGEGLGPLGAFYEVALHVALAREDHVASGQAIASLQRLHFKDGRWVGATAWLDANLRDDPAPLRKYLASLTDLEMYRLGTYGSEIQFICERGQTVPESFVARDDATPPEPWFDGYRRSMAIARALAADDNVALANAIDEAEAHGLIPHAARMRIALAQRTGDRAQLERARAALERLGDRQFLRKLEAVAAELAGAE